MALSSQRSILSFVDQERSILQNNFYTMARITEILGNPDGFLRTIFSHLASDQIDVSNSELDHICYRVETEARYEELKNILETSYAVLLSEAII